MHTQLCVILALTIHAATAAAQQAATEPAPSTGPATPREVTQPADAGPAVAAAPPTDAAPSAAPAQPTGDDAAVRQALTQYVEAFNAQDAKALAALWTEGGTHVNKETGERTVGREALQSDFTALFTGSPSVTLSGDVQDIRIIGGDTALVDGMSTVVSPGEEPAMSAYSAVYVKEDGRWLLDTIYESDLPVAETPRQALAPLEWMVGTWIDDSESATVTSAMRWSPSDAFLIRSYDVQREGEDPFQGQQVIGWDPAGHQIRSWTFNSDGSFGEGSWSRNGREWVVRKVETLPDGRLGSGTQILKQVDKDTIEVQTIAKETDGVPEPRSEPVLMRRVAESTGATPENAAPATAAIPAATTPGAQP